MDMFGQRWQLFADPRIKTDAVLIGLFSRSNLFGSVIPTGASAGQPELRNEKEVSVEGFEKISNFLEQHITH